MVSPAACRILIVEDEKEVVRFLKEALRAGAVRHQTHFQIRSTENVDDASRIVESSQCDIVISDLNLVRPGGGVAPVREVGIKFIENIRETPYLGIIVYSREPIDEYGPDLIDLGADDYIEKPEEPKLISSKVFSLWRRILELNSLRVMAKLPNKGGFRLGEYKFDVRTPVLTSGIKTIKLTVTEHKILTYFLKDEDFVLDGDSFYAFAYGRIYDGVDRALENAIARLRKKLSGIAEIHSAGMRLYTLSGAEAA